MSQGQVRIRAEARRDLDQHSDYMLAEAGAAIASRFVAAARQSFDAIAQEPSLGPAVQSTDPRLAGMRKWRIKGFPKYLIFYQPTPGGIRVVRVMHAAQDWWGMLDAD